MRLHVHEWGDPGAHPIVCIHGATGHGERFKQLAEERWSRLFRVIAPDLRGHGRSGWEPPWTIEAHVADLVETVAGLGQVDWVGHSFGGRLILELAARHPDRIHRAVLLDPAIQLLPHVAEAAAVKELRTPEWTSVEACLASRDDAGGADRERALSDLALQLVQLPNGRLRRRTSPDAVTSIFRELVNDPPPPEAMRMPSLLVQAPAYGLVDDKQAAAYGRNGVLTVPGMHMVMWSAFDETATAVERFLAPGNQ